MNATEVQHRTTEDVASELAVSVSTVCRWIEQGVLKAGHRVRLHAYKVGQAWRIPVEAVPAFVRACNPERQVQLASERKRAADAAEAAEKELEEMLKPRRRGR